MVEINVRRDPDVVQMEHEHWNRTVLLSFASARWQILNIVKMQFSKYSKVEIQDEALAGFISQYPREVIQMIIPPEFGTKDQHKTSTFPPNSTEATSHDEDKTTEKPTDEPAPLANVNKVDKSTSTQVDSEVDRRDVASGSDEILSINFCATSPAEKEEEPTASSPPPTPLAPEQTKPACRHEYEKSNIYSHSPLYDRKYNGVPSSACDETEQSCSDFDSSISSGLQMSSTASTVAIHVQGSCESPNNVAADKSTVEGWGELGKWKLPERVDAHSIAPVGSVQMDMKFHEQELYQVQLLRFNNPNEVFVVPYIKTRESLNIRLRRWFAEESHIPLRIRSLDDVHLGLPVLVKCQSFCRRAVIQEVNAGTGGVTIWLVDFGEKRTHVKLWSLLYMPRAFAEIPAQAMKFSLGAAHYNDSDEGLARMRDIAKHFTYSYMQVLDGSDGDFSNCDRKYVDFILRDKGYGQSSSLRHRLVALSLASFDDISQQCSIGAFEITQEPNDSSTWCKSRPRSSRLEHFLEIASQCSLRDMDEMSDVTTLGGPPSTSDGALTLEEKTDLESDRDRTPQYSRSSSPSQPDIVVANGAVSTTHNDAARNPFSARALLPPVPYGRTRISVRDARRQSSQSSSTVSTEQKYIIKVGRGSNK